ncbi:hypothetical protein HK102_004284 [Quaeritorhiza haematococci]|nr:hypothetical protein HK102_004284 [Quaeritorhiza haematococci]
MDPVQTAAQDVSGGTKTITKVIYNQSYSTAFRKFLDELYYCFVEPVAFLLGFSRSDSTYGRAALPFSQHEQHILSNHFSHCGYYSTHLIIPPYGKLHINVWYPIDTSSKPSDEPSPSNPASIHNRKQGPVVVIAHGLGEYGGRYAQFAPKFTEQGYTVVAPDFYGFGRSAGLHGYIPSTWNLVDSLHHVMEYVHKEWVPRDEKDERKAVVLFGASMGGHISLLYATKYQDAGFVDCLTLLCPLVYAAKESTPAPFVQVIAKGLRFVIPRLPIASANRGKATKQLHIEQAFADNPLNYVGPMRIGTGLSLLETMGYLEEHLHVIRLPYLLQQGKVDIVVDHRGSEKAHQLANSEDKTLKMYEDGEHELLRVESVGERVLKDLFAWLGERIDKDGRFVKVGSKN